MDEPDYWLEPWLKYADFSGRARRKEYWYFTLEIILFSIMLFLIIGIMENLGGKSVSTESGRPDALTSVVILIFGLVTVLPSLSVTVRRLHDTGKSGWWYFISAVPFIGRIILLVFMLQDSTPGKNQYGPNPKGIQDPLYDFIGKESRSNF